VVSKKPREAVPYKCPLRGAKKENCTVIRHGRMIYGGFQVPDRIRLRNPRDLRLV
jgi:hypothetical protein